MAYIDDIIHRDISGELRAEDIREMIYTPDRCDEILVDSYYKGVRYIIRSIGIHPCAYVECTQEFLDRHPVEFDCMEGVHVHGGVTWDGSLEWKTFKGIEGVFFGWDYGHAGDWTGYHSEDENLRAGNKKWETWMIINDCKDAIDQYLEQKEKDYKFSIELKTLEEMKQYCDEIKNNPVFDDALMFAWKTDINKYKDLLYQQVCREGYQEEYEEKLENKLKAYEDKH